MKAQYFRVLWLVSILISQRGLALPGNVRASGPIDSLSCFRSSPPSEAQMIQYLDSRLRDPEYKIDQEYRGIQFKDESPELIAYFVGIHRNIMDSIFAPKPLQETSCDKVLCVLEQYYGKKIPLRMLYIYAKFGISISPLSANVPENYQNWTFAESNDILIALESIPPSLLPLKDRHILHFKNGYTLKTYGPFSGVAANARIDVFDIWNTESRPERIATLIHEVGHVLGYGLDQSPEWTSLPKKFVSIYAKTNQAEDFAETFLAYRVAPQWLKNVSYEKYDFIKEKVFHGLEFKTQKDCELPYRKQEQSVAQATQERREITSWVENNKSKIETEIRRQEEVGYFKRMALERCSEEYLREVVGGSYHQTQICLERVVKERAAQVTMIRESH